MPNGDCERELRITEPCSNACPPCDHQKIDRRQVDQPVMHSDGFSKGAHCTLPVEAGRHRIRVHMTKIRVGCPNASRHQASQHRDL